MGKGGKKKGRKGSKWGGIKVRMKEGKEVSPFNGVKTPFRPKSPVEKNIDINVGRTFGRKNLIFYQFQ